MTTRSDSSHVDVGAEVAQKGHLHQERLDELALQPEALQPEAVLRDERRVAAKSLVKMVQVTATKKV